MYRHLEQANPVLSIYYGETSSPTLGLTDKLSGAAAFVQALFGIGARSLKRGREAEENAGDDTDQKGECKDRSADVNVVRAWKVGGQERDERERARGSRGLE